MTKLEPLKNVKIYEKIFKKGLTKEGGCGRIKCYLSGLTHEVAYTSKQMYGNLCRP